MTDIESDVSLATLSARLDELADLFKRRLLDDRVKQAAIDELQARLRRAESAQAAEALRPLVIRIALVIERLKGVETDRDASDSIVEELEDALETLGVTRVAVTGTVDPRRHEIVSVTGEGPVLWVDELVRAGYEKDGVVLRPARITAVRIAADVVAADSDSGVDE